jgi:AraC-like DNA-binding protein
MTQLSTVEFTDPQPYQVAIRPAQVEILVTTKGDFHGAVTQIELPRLLLQRGRENLPRIANATMRADRPAFFFLSGADQASVRHSGRDLAPSEIVVSASCSTQHHRTEGPCQWATLSMARDDFAAASHAIAGRDLIEPSVTRYIRPHLPMMSRLSNLHQTVGQLAESAANILAQPEAVRALEQALLHAMITCLSDNAPVQMDTGALRHAAIIARFEEVLAANYDQPLYLAEICAAIGASERVLRISCMEHLGVGPVRYLWLRRMHLVHRALVLAAPAAVSVTEIATGNGFFELGRFAVEYRALFGEAPSASLRRPAQEMRVSRSSAFAFADSEYA